MTKSIIVGPLEESPEEDCEFVIKDGFEFCIKCGKIREIIPPMCEIIGECEWITINNIEFCPHCGRLKKGVDG